MRAAHLEGGRTEVDSAPDGIEPRRSPTLLDNSIRLRERVQTWHRFRVDDFTKR
jgi:hypothetical protein